MQLKGFCSTQAQTRPMKGLSTVSIQSPASNSPEDVHMASAQLPQHASAASRPQPSQHAQQHEICRRNGEACVGEELVLCIEGLPFVLDVSHVRALILPPCLIGVPISLICMAGQFSAMWHAASGLDIASGTSSNYCKFASL